jgi:hypothetical protein
MLAALALFAVPGLVAWARRLPLPEAWYARPPLGCVYCLASWASAGLGLAVAYETSAVVGLLAFGAGLFGGLAAPLLVPWLYERPS